MHRKVVLGRGLKALISMETAATAANGAPEPSVAAPGIAEQGPVVPKGIHIADIEPNPHTQLLAAREVECVESLLNGSGTFDGSRLSSKEAMIPSPVCFTSRPLLSLRARRTSAS